MSVAKNDVGHGRLLSERQVAVHAYETRSRRGRSERTRPSFSGDAMQCNAMQRDARANDRASERARHGESPASTTLFLSREPITIGARALSCRPPEAMRDAIKSDTCVPTQFLTRVSSARSLFRTFAVRFALSFAPGSRLGAPPAAPRTGSLVVISGEIQLRYFAPDLIACERMHLLNGPGLRNAGSRDLGSSSVSFLVASS